MRGSCSNRDFRSKISKNPKMGLFAKGPILGFLEWPVLGAKSIVWTQILYAGLNRRLSSPYKIWAPTVNSEPSTGHPQNPILGVYGVGPAEAKNPRNRRLSQIDAFWGFFDLKIRLIGPKLPQNYSERPIGAKTIFWLLGTPISEQALWRPFSMVRYMKNGRKSKFFKKPKNAVLG